MSVSLSLGVMFFITLLFTVPDGPYPLDQSRIPIKRRNVSDLTFLEVILSFSEEVVIINQFKPSPIEKGSTISTSEHVLVVSRLPRLEVATTHLRHHHVILSPQNPTRGVWENSRTTVTSIIIPSGRVHCTSHVSESTLVNWR